MAAGQYTSIDCLNVVKIQLHMRICTNPCGKRNESEWNAFKDSGTSNTGKALSVCPFVECCEMQ